METDMRTPQITLSDSVFRTIAEITETVSRPRRGARAASGRSATGPTAPSRRLGWLERLEQWQWRQEQRSVEAYLAQSQDVFELEARIRALQRGNPWRYY